MKPLEPPMEPRIPRELLRDADQIDLGKAKPSCPRCYGRGITGHLHREGQRMPIVCRCVTQNGGVRPATSAEELIARTRELPLDVRRRAIAAIERRLSASSTDASATADTFALTHARRVLVHDLAREDSMLATVPLDEQVSGCDTLEPASATATAREVIQ